MVYNCGSIDNIITQYLLVKMWPLQCLLDVTFVNVTYISNQKIIKDLMVLTYLKQTYSATIT